MNIKKDKNSVLWYHHIQNSHGSGFIIKILRHVCLLQNVPEQEINERKNKKIIVLLHEESWTCCKHNFLFFLWVGYIFMTHLQYFGLGCTWSTLDSDIQGFIFNYCSWLWEIKASNIHKGKKLFYPHLCYIMCSELYSSYVDTQADTQTHIHTQKSLSRIPCFISLCKFHSGGVVR